MNFSVTFYLNAGGLFDFDLTIAAEAILFIILALVVTYVFIAPISKQLDERAEFINYNLRKSTILVNFGYETSSKCLKILTDEVTELNRQIQLTKLSTDSHFEAEVTSVQEENTILLNQLKGELSIKSAYLFSNITTDLFSLTDKFFIKKFQSAS